jgi:ketopantoate reductase
MSATMQQALASLLVRRTGEARAEAQRRIDVWQKAIEAVWQAERIAEYKIHLPIEQVRGAAGSDTVEMVNYILAVDLANKAIDKRNAVIATATAALQKESEERQRAETRAKQALHAATSEHDNAIAAAKREWDAESGRIQSEMEKERG